MHEKRAHPRSALGVPITCEQAGAGEIVGTARDISLGGMFIECSAPAPRFGTVLTVVCRLPGASRELRLPGIVRWSARGGFGVQFGMLGARETYAITHLPRKSA